MEDILKLIADRENDYPHTLYRARELLLARRENETKDSEILARLAEVQYWLGRLAGDDTASEAFLAEGVEYGKKAAALGPDSVAANFWYANCMAAHGMVRGMMNSLFYLEPMEKHGNRALELDETFLQAAPLSMMARYYSKTPPWPVGSGDKKKGLELAKRAVKLEPDHLGNKVVLADAWLAARYFDEAKALLKEVLAAPEPEDFRLNHARYLAEAKQVLERLESME